MNFIGVDLHKKIITVCVMNEKLKVLARKTLYCDQPDEIVEFFQQFRPSRWSLRPPPATSGSSTSWNHLAEKVVLANPNKLRVIAESTKKTDRLDAQVLAEFLARDMIPESYMPTPRQRQHRALVRHRQYIRGRMTSVRCKIRRVLSDYNADRKDLFSPQCGPAYLKQVALSDADRFVIKQLWAEYEDHQARLLALTKKIKAFAAKAPKREAEARAVLKTVPGVGTVTTEVVLSELGDMSRFRNAKAISPTPDWCRSSAKLGARSPRTWGSPSRARGCCVGRWWRRPGGWSAPARNGPLLLPVAEAQRSKRAIVAVARKLLCVMYAMLKTSTPYKIAGRRNSSTTERNPGKEVNQDEPNPASVRASHLSSEGRWT